MRSVVAVTLVAIVAMVSPVHAQGRRGMMGAELAGGGRPFGPPPFLRQLFAPRLVMEHQADIGLRPEQVDAIKKAMGETQQSLLQLQWKLDAESEALAKLLATDHVDEAKVAAKLDDVTAIERDVKKINFLLLVRVKNQLDAEKLRPLAALRGEGPPPDAPPPE